MTNEPTLKFPCDVEITRREGAPIPIGQSPWTSRRVSDIAAGTFRGPPSKDA